MSTILKLYKDIWYNDKKNLDMWAEHEHVAAIFFSLLCQCRVCFTGILQLKIHQIKIFFNDIIITFSTLMLSTE